VEKLIEPATVAASAAPLASAAPAASTASASASSSSASSSSSWPALAPAAPTASGAELAPHRYRNNSTVVTLGNLGWQPAADRGLLGIRVAVADTDDRLRDRDGHEFVNLSSCSYLGLHRHPAILQGAINALRRERAFGLSIAPLRVQLALQDELESGLASLYRARSISTASASVATAGVLPLIASGHLCDDGRPRVMVFDRYSHFSMSLMKPICADESAVITAPHNDLDFVADVCRRHPRVAYVSDGAYSMGGSALIDGLLDLQDRYGLFLYLDDSHALSIVGQRGEGFVRSRLGSELNPLTIISGSLSKAFGTAGGVIMLGPARHEATLARFGGPLAWSQEAPVATVGASLASIAIHLSPELARLQDKLRSNVALFDTLLPTEQRGNGLNIRLFETGAEARAVAISARLFERGFYSSAVFFPIVERGKAGLRVMIRADNRPDDLRRFCAALREAVKNA
jgi:7-keto-8-aminopelargonate synthetase-like enzyme